MITITNQARRNKRGETLYRVAINGEFVAEFWHKREYGLAMCLRSAADVVGEMEREKWAKIARQIMNEQKKEIWQRSKPKSPPIAMLNKKE